MSSLLSRRSAGLLIALSLLAATWPSRAPATEGSGQRPRIGLALSGGGARGAAHVGVLRVLEQMRIPVDYIAGTSMGAIVGGLYAAGLSVDDIEQALIEIPWANVFSDRQPRDQRRFRRKMDDYTFLVPYKVGVDERDKDVSIAPALIQGQKFDLTLRKYTLPAARIRDFDRLRIPFRAVATNIVTGEAVVLGDGDLAQALRASMAVPAAFSPVEIDDRLLVDGGMAMNLPVSVVRDMGADVVIAVDISTPGLTREELKSALDMLNQLSALLTRPNTEAQIASLKGRDVLIVPSLGKRVATGDFEPKKLLEAVAVGEAGAHDKQAELGRLALPQARYSVYRERIAPLPGDPPLIDYVRIENDSRLDDEVITRRIDIETGEPLNPGSLEEGIGRVYDQDNFASVRYRMEDEAGKTGVVVTASEKSWGTSSLQFGLELSSTTADDSYFNLGAAYTMSPVNRLNAEWRTFLRVGQEPLLFTEYYQPLDPDEHWFVNFGGGYVNRNFRLYDDRSADAPVVEYDADSLGIRLAAGRNLEDWGRLSLGYSRFTGDADVRTGDNRFEDFSFDDGGLKLELSLDTLDNVIFPSKGWRGFLYGGLSRRSLGADTDFEQAGVSVMAAGGHGRHRYNALAYFETTLDDNAPIQNLFRLGGLARLSGFNENQLAGQNAGLLRAAYFYDLQTKLVDTYVGGTLEAGNVWQDRGDIGLGSTVGAGSLFLGVDTVIGPVFLGYGHAEGANNAWYLLLGKPWFRF